MPIYEYKGQRYNISTNDPVLAKQKILKYLGEAAAPPVPEVPETPPLRATSALEDINEGVKTIIPTMTNAGLLALGGIGGALGQEDFRDAMFEGYTERSEALKNRDKEQGVNRGEWGKVLKAVGQIPAYLSPTTAAMMIGSGALNSGADIVKEGGDEQHALASTMADAGSSAAMLALGPLANLSGRTSNAILQGGLNVGQEALINHPVQNTIRESAGISQLPAMTAGDYGAAFIPGAAMGAAFPKRTGTQTKAPETDPSLLETRLPSVADLDSNFIKKSNQTLDSISKQIARLQTQQEDLSKNGPMTEKQFKFYQELEKQIQFKKEEAAKITEKLSKYEQPQEVKQTPEELADAIRNLEITPKGNNKEKGSWDPFLGEEEYRPEELRPDDSNAPGIHPDNTSFKPEEEYIPDRRSQVRNEMLEKWKRGVNESEERYQDRIDELTTKKLRFEAQKERNQPDEIDLINAGIITRFSKGDSKKKTPLRTLTVKQIEYELNKSRSMLAAIERRMSNEHRELDGLTPVMKQDESSANGRTYHVDSNGKKIVTYDSDQGKANLLLDKIGRLEESLAKAKSLQNRFAEAGNTSAVKATAEKKKSGYAQKDSADYTPDPLKIIWETLQDVKSYQDLPTKKSIIGTMFEKLLGEKTSWAMSDSSNLVRAGYSLKDILSHIARIHSVEQGEKGKVPLLYYDKEGYIGRFDIPEDLQERGLGKVLWETVKQEIGGDRFYLLSKPESVGFWKKMGFKVDEGTVGEKGDNVPMSMGQWAPFRPKGESGMWIPFATKHNENENLASRISTSLDVSNNIDVTKLNTSKDLLERVTRDKVPDSSTGIIKEIFGRGQLVESIKRAQPIVWEIAKRIRIAKDQEIANKRTWWSGSASDMVAKAFGPFMKLSHYDNPQSPEHVRMASTDKDRVSITEYMQLAHREGVNHIQKDNPNLTEKQRMVLDEFNKLTPFQQAGVRIFTKMLEQIRQTRKIPYLAGFIPHVRDGDFAVYLKTSKGDPAHLETFKSKMIAENWIAEAKKKGYSVSDVIDFTTPEGQTLAESFGLVRDIMTHLNSDDPRKQKWINRVLDETLEKVSKNPDIGRHREHYTGLSGFMGSKLFKNRLENANDFFKSMEEYAQTSAAQNKKVQLIRESNKFWDNPEGRKLRELYPNQAQTADFLTDVAMNKDQKYDWVSSLDNFRDKVDDFYARMWHGVSKQTSKLTGKEPDLLYYPDVPVLDRVTGAGAQLFYISALTTRPGFWVGQFLTSPFAARQFFKEASIADVMKAQGEAWGTIMTGGDAAWKEFVKDMANKSDSLHPQFINEINNLPGISKMGSLKVQTIVEVLTGQKPASIADSISRYTVAAMAYHHYKNMGMVGEQLAANVKRAVDDTMVMYDRESSPPMFNKMGIAGQHIAPLQKYGLAQLANLIGDLKYIAQKPEGVSTIRAMLPAVSTLMTTMIMAGSIGLPLLVEYEILRSAFIGVAEFFGNTTLRDQWPSVIELMLTNHEIRDTLMAAGADSSTAQFAEDASTHGVLSAATGFDIGSSLRFNAYVPDGSNVDPLSAIPIVKFLVDMGKFAAIQVRKHTAHDVTEAEDRASQLKPQFIVGQRAAVDEFRFKAGERDYVPGGGRGYAQVEQTPKERIGTLIGAKPLETSKKNAELQIELKNDRKNAEMRQRAVDLFTDALSSGDSKKEEVALDLATRAEMTPKELLEQVKSAMHERTTPRWEDRFTNRKGQIKSNQQMRKFERADRYE